MKSSISNVTESIENKSLPSIPVKSTTRQIVEELKPDVNNDENARKDSLIESYFERNLQLASHTGPQSAHSLLFSNKISYSSNDCTSEEGTESSKNNKEMKVKLKLYEKARLRRRCCNPEKYQKLDYTINVETSDSVHLPRLLPPEADFLQLVADDNVTAVRTYLEEHPGLNINCVNYQGVSALHIAVKNRSEAMVEFLLKQPNIEIGDTIMHAVRENNVKILVKLLDTQKEICPGLEFVGSTHSPDFPEYVTPLMFAAQNGNYEVVALLVHRGHTISRPHMPNCLCEKCKQSLETDDPLRASSARLAVYRAVAAPAFLVHVSSDPILAAFRLTRELADNAAAYRQQAAQYLQLRDDVSAFTVDLLGIPLI